MENVAIVQARMMSSRLPNKILLDINGYPMFEWVLKRLKKSKNLDLIVFALPDSKTDDILEERLIKLGAKVLRGSENDLVDRFYRVAQKVDAQKIIRVCADNPFICASEVDRLIDFYNFSHADYAYTHIPKMNLYPDGIGAEICSMKILEEINKKATSSQHREHLFNYIWDNKLNYEIKTFDPPDNLAFPSLKLDVDTMSDYLKLTNKNYQIDMTAEAIIRVSLGKKYEIT